MGKTIAKYTFVLTVTIAELFLSFGWLHLIFMPATLFLSYCLANSFYSVPNEKILLLQFFYSDDAVRAKGKGLRFAPWPLFKTHSIINAETKSANANANPPCRMNMNIDGTEELMTFELACDEISIDWQIDLFDNFFYQEKDGVLIQQQLLPPTSKQEKIDEYLQAKANKDNTKLIKHFEEIVKDRVADIVNAYYVDLTIFQALSVHGPILDIQVLLQKQLDQENLPIKIKRVSITKPARALQKAQQRQLDRLREAMLSKHILQVEAAAAKSFLKIFDENNERLENMSQQELVQLYLEIKTAETNKRLAEANPNVFTDASLGIKS